MSSCAWKRGGPCSGRAALFGVALFLAAGLCAVGAYVVFQEDPSERPLPRAGETTAIPAPPAAESAKPREPTPSQSPVAAAPAETAAPAAAAPTETAAAPAAAEPNTLRIVGVVSSVDGTPVAGATLTWAPPAEQSITTDDDGDAGRIQVRIGKRSIGRDSKSKDKSSQRSTRSGADGKFELAVPIRGGTVTATADGYANAEHEVGVPDSPTDSPGATPPLPLSVELSVLLRKGAKISGRVTDSETGAPAAGVLVVAAPDRPGDNEPFAAFRARFEEVGARSEEVAEDGTYVLAGLEPGNFRVELESGESYYLATPMKEAKKISLRAGDDTRDVDFKTLRGGVISGKLTDADGNPVAQAMVSATPKLDLGAMMNGDLDPGLFEGLRNGGTQSDSEGHYECKALPLERDYTVSVQPAEQAPARSDPVSITRAERERIVDLVLFAGSRVEGVVLDEQGAPAAEVQVSMMANMEEMLSGGFVGAAMSGGGGETTDPVGAFAFEHVAPGKYQLTAQPPGNLTFRWGEAMGTEVEVIAGQDVTGLVLTLGGGSGVADRSESRARGTIAGKVVDSDGEPVEGASVSLQSITMGAFSTANATTDSAGTFSASVDGKGPFTVTASKDGLQEAELADIVPGQRHVLLTLTRLAAISGMVMTADGPAPEGFKVSARELPDENSPMQERFEVRFGGGTEEWVNGNPDGSFTIEEAPVGRVEVVASVPGYALGRSSPIDTTSGRHIENVTVRVSVGGSVEGKVTAVDAPLVAGATVRLIRESDDPSEKLFARMMPAMFAGTGGETATDESGMFRLEHLAPGNYELTVTHSGYAPSERIAVEIRGDGAVKAPAIQLTRGASLEVVVFDKKKQKPFTGATIQVVGDAPMKMGTTDAEGRATFDGLPPGSYMVTVIDMASMQQGAMNQKVKGVTIEPGKDQRLEIVIGAGQKVFGKVTGLADVGMIQVTLRRPDGPAPEDLDYTNIETLMESTKYLAGQTIAIDGAYSIEDVEPGEYILEIPRMPENPMDLAAYQTMDRTPHFRKTVEVGNQDLEIDIDVSGK